jgi:hypothetical protein
MRRLLLVWHQSHLVRDVLEPGLVGLTVSDHFGKPGIVSFGQLERSWRGLEKGCLLLTDHGLLNKLLSKDHSLIAPFDTFLCHKSHHAGDGTYNGKHLQHVRRNHLLDIIHLSWLKFERIT